MKIYKTEKNIKDIINQIIDKTVEITKYNNPYFTEWRYQDNKKLIDQQQLLIDSLLEMVKDLG